MRAVLAIMLASLMLFAACHREDAVQPAADDGRGEDVLPKVPDFPGGYRPEEGDKLHCEFSPTSAELLEGDTLKLTVRVTNVGPRPLRPWMAVDAKRAGSQPIGRHVLYPGKAQTFDVSFSSALFADGKHELVLWAHTDVPQAGKNTSTYDFPVEGKPVVVSFTADVERLPEPYVEQ